MKNSKYILFAYILLCIFTSLTAQRWYIGEDLIIEKDKLVENDINIVRGDVHIYGTLKGNINIVYGTVYLYESSRITGNIGLHLSSIKKHHFATHTGNTGGINSLESFGDYLQVKPGRNDEGNNLLKDLLALFAFMVISLFMLRKHSGRISNDFALHRKRYFFTGLFILALVIAITLILLISIIGIFLIPLVVLGYGLMILFAVTFSAIHLSSMLFGRPSGFSAALMYLPVPLIGYYLLHILMENMAAGGGLVYFGATVLNIVIKIFILYYIISGTGKLFSYFRARKKYDQDFEAKFGKQ